MGKEEQVSPNELVTTERTGDIQVITIDNPPTAALSSSVRLMLGNILNRALSDDLVKGLVITGVGANFATGGGLNDTVAEDAPSLADICDRMEASDKPIVAAIGGPALGGGLEIALAAHLRVGSPLARLGAPEITLGLVPNAGGTQRLPKVIGGVAALKMLLSGRAVGAAAARKLGLLDDLVAENLLDAALQHALSLAESDGDLRRSSTRRDRLGEGTAFLEAVAIHRKAADMAPLVAPTRMIECVEAALLLPYDIGRGLEQSAFDDLIRSEHSKSLRHIFASERKLMAATNWEGRVMSRVLNAAAVVGATGLCAEVAVQCLDAGFDVTLVETSEQDMEKAVGRIIGHYDARIAAGTMSEEDVEQVLDRMHAVPGYQSLGEADIVIDPSPSLTKRRVAALDGAMRAGAILLVAGERVAMDQVAEMTGRETDVVGMRFFPNVKKNRLIELSASEKTGPRAIATARQLARKLDRLIVDVSPSREAIGTRLAEALHAAADLCMEDGASIEQIDAALRDWGLPHGSFAWRDLVGIHRPSSVDGIEGQRGGGIDPVLVSVGRVGLSVGKGYYAYTERGRPGVLDDDVRQMIEADREAKGITATRLSDGEIRKRCVASMTGAGAEMLIEGMAKRPSDIDMVAVHGLGFARRTGGIMFAADLVGLDKIHAALVAMSEQSDRIPAPPDMLQDLVNSKQGLSDLNS